MIINFFKKFYKHKSFLEHLKLLCNLLLFVGVLFLLIFIVIYVFLKKPLLNLLMEYIKNTLNIPIVIYLNIYDSFFIPIRISFYISCVITFTILMIGLLIFGNILLGGLFLLLPLPFCFYGIFKYLIPLTWKSFYNLHIPFAFYLGNLQDVLNFILHMTICGLLTIYIPFFILTLYYLKLIPSVIMSAIRKYWIFISIIVSGFLAPGDVLSHLLMSLTMVLMFETLFFLLTIVKKFRK
jgi:sec-independent protein translocase protein TatC